MSDASIENLGPLAGPLQSLIENSGLELGAVDTLTSLLAEMIGQYGVQLPDVQIVRTCLNPNTSSSVKAEKIYRYDAAFPDPHPDGENALITLRAYMQRDWQAPAFTRYADAAEADLDQFARPRGKTIATHDPALVFSEEPKMPMSKSVIRERAKKAAEAREEREAATRAAQ